VAHLCGGLPDTALRRARLTTAASIAFALGVLPPGTVGCGAGRGEGGRLLLWIVGAREAMEGELARRGLLAEPLAALWPPAARHGVELILCGPEMREWGPADQRPPPRPLVRAVSGTLHSRLKDAPALTTEPDAMLLLNSGVGTLLLPLVAPWLPTLAAVLAMRVPCILTCYNASEAAGQEALLRLFGARTLLPSRQNPFAHAAPLPLLAEGLVITSLPT